MGLLQTLSKRSGDGQAGKQGGIFNDLKQGFHCRIKGPNSTSQNILAQYVDAARSLAFVQHLRMAELLCRYVALE
jgi:hypothetical protein